MTQWQPIETAPKDGSKIILFYIDRNGNERTVFGRWLTDEQAEDCDHDDVGLKAGWYETIENWGDYSFVAIHGGEPTLWTTVTTPSNKRGINMTQWQPIETAPIECFGSSEEENPEILVYSRWDWDGMDREECSLEYSWRVAEYENGHFWSVTSNPYRDKAFNPTHWMPVPTPPATIEKGE